VAARTRFVDRLLQNPGRGMQRVAPPAPMSIHKRRLSPGSCRKSGDLRKIPPDFLCIRPGKHKTWVHMRGMSTRVLVLSGDMRGLSTDMARRRPILEESDPGLCVCGPTSGGCAPTSAACGSTSPACDPGFCACRPIWRVHRSGVCACGHTCWPDEAAYRASQIRIAEFAPASVPTERGPVVAQTARQPMPPSPATSLPTNADIVPTVVLGDPQFAVCVATGPRTTVSPGVQHRFQRARFDSPKPSIKPTRS
jgi:hypothetical protein